MNGDALLFFDGECRLCRRAVAILARWDRRDRIVMLPFQHPLTSRLLPDVTPEELSRAMVLLGPRGRRYHGADAISPLLGLLPGGFPLRLFFEIPGVPALARRVYRLVAEHRHELGCALPPRRATA